MGASEHAAFNVRAHLQTGQVIPAHPLALTPTRDMDERHQRALTRYYVAAGAGGMAVGVHTTGFPIHDPKIGLYRGFTSSMDEGWTRLVFDIHGIKYRNIQLAEVRNGIKDVDVLIVPSESEGTILNGLSAERFPDEFVGGIGEQGIANMKKFVEDGGRLICFDASCGMVIKAFDLPVRNVLSGLKRNEFYNPGSIVRLDVNLSHRLAEGVDEILGAYFINSSAFEVTDRTRVRTVARYAARDALVSGWMLGESFINGRSAVVESDFGKGKIVMFAFRPQHRGQTFGTFPLLFNAIEK